MALQLSYSGQVSGDCLNLVLQDNTGNLEGTNYTGYCEFCDINPKRDEILTCTCSITFPDTTIKTGISLTLPTTQPTITVLSAASLGFIELEEGIYTITVTETTASVTYSTTFSFLNSCLTQCCLDKQIINLDITDCSCFDSKLSIINKIDYYLEAASEAAKCNKPLKAGKLLSAAKFLCNQKNCSC